MSKQTADTWTWHARLFDLTTAAAQQGNGCTNPLQKLSFTSTSQLFDKGVDGFLYYKLIIL